MPISFATPFGVATHSLRNPGLDHLSFRSNAVLIKCRFDQVLFRPSVVSINVVSIKCRFDQVSFRPSVVSTKCRFDEVSFRSSVVSIKCRFDQVSFRSSVVSINCRVTSAYSDLLPLL